MILLEYQIRVQFLLQKQRTWPWRDIIINKQNLSVEMSNVLKEVPDTANLPQKQDNSLIMIKTTPKTAQVEQPKLKNKDELTMRQQAMMKKAQEILTNVDYDFWSSQYHKLAGFRQKYINELLKLLLYSYQEVTSEVNIKKLLNQDYLITAKTLKLLSLTTNFQETISYLKQLSIKIERQIFQICNTAGSQTKEGRKYNFQFKHLLTNIKASNNQVLRQNIVNGTYPPQYIGCMDQIDMLQPRKREYLQTKCAKYLSDKQNKRIRKSKKERQQRAFHILENQAKERQKQAAKQAAIQKEKIENFHKFVKELNMQYFFTREPIQNFQVELMEIPMKIVRKKTLANLQSTFDSFE